jgi:hypothetical protein
VRRLYTRFRFVYVQDIKKKWVVYIISIKIRMESVFLVNVTEGKKVSIKSILQADWNATIYRVVQAILVVSIKKCIEQPIAGRQ